MDIKGIFEDNIHQYSDYVSRDATEDMSRMYYRGIAGHDPDDDSLLSLLIWELKSVESSTDTQSELKWIYAADSTYLASLLDEYSEEAQSEDVGRTFFEGMDLEIVSRLHIY